MNDLMAYVETAEGYAVRPLPVSGGTHEACTPADAPRLDPIIGGEPSAGEMAAYTAAAQELCAHCPLIDICAAEADRGAEVGVWGGALRYRAGGGPRGEYVVVPLIPGAPESVHDRAAVAARLARKRALVGAARGSGE